MISQTCFWWPWQFRGLLISYFVECPSIGVFPMFLLWFKKPHCGTCYEMTDNYFSKLIKCHHVYQRYILSVWLTTIDVDLDYLAEVEFVRLLHCKFTPFTHVPPHLHTALFGGVPYWRSAELCSTSLRVVCLHELFRILHRFLPHLVRHLYQYELIDIIFYCRF